ncbi:Charged multivesicular body protein 5 (Vacuolar protein-sorting-associated protein 60), partial [Durusdinium trenchii]
QRALGVLKKKKMYEKQRDALGNQQFNVDQQNFMLESMRDTQDTVATMKDSAKAMKKQFKQINLDKIEDLQEDISEMMYDHEEVQEVMGRALGFDAEDIDESELDDELAALDDLDLEDLEDETEADYLKPSKLPSAPTENVESEKDQYGLPAMPVADP